MRLHPLQGVNEETASLQIKRLGLGRDGTIHGASRPKGVSHRTPGVGGISAKIRRAVLADHEAGSGSGEGQIHQAVLVHRGLDGVRRALVIQRQRKVIGTT